LTILAIKAHRKTKAIRLKQIKKLTNPIRLFFLWSRNNRLW